jgi:hypothetical protein
MATGLNKASGQRFHFDIYALLEGSQELYFGHEVQVNVNLVERVKVRLPSGEEIEKCYLSPTKRRGVERRALLWAPTGTGQLLGDALDCGIPRTCAKQDCPICNVYGGLITESKGGRERTTFIGRLTHGGGVAIQAQPPEEKQRAMHPSDIRRSGSGEEPTPFRREYNQPGLLYPVYNHCLSVTDEEFRPVAYAFQDSLARIGAGNPKGTSIAQYQGMSLIVLDRYLVPKGERPTLSPSLFDVTEAYTTFLAAASRVGGNVYAEDHIGKPEENFERWKGQAALNKLGELADGFVNDVLRKK